MKNGTEIKQFRASNYTASGLLLIPTGLLSSGLFLSLSGNIYAYVAGQIFLAFFFFQCFILLHETGHYSFFKNARANTLFGNIFGFISIIPFESWVEMHNLHHRWTGWRDRDPTTEDTVNKNYRGITRFIVNASWLLWFPLFTIAYRYNNYWQPAKLKKYLTSKKRKRILNHAIVQILCYVSLFFFFGKFIAVYLLPGYFLSLVISDVFILSQHSHIPMPLAGDAEVKALRYPDQVQYTRSISFKKFIANFLYFNFNLHELHHAYPGVSAYNLGKIEQQTPNKVGFYDYLVDAKQMKGVDFIFKTSGRIIGKKIKEK